jgi:hypothetical protein
MISECVLLAVVAEKGSYSRFESGLDR